MRTLPWLLSALALAAVLAVFLLATRQPSPGPLHPVHARVPELAECAACHPRSERMDEACLACHDEIAARRAAGRGIHGDARPCAECHGEHFGAEPVLLSPASFARAGIEDVAAFDHAGLDLGLVGRHETLDCARCHAHADAPLLPAGRSRYLGLDARCSSCHEDPHDGAYGSLCGECHAQDVPFAEARGRAHDRFPLAGSHADLACSRCHEESGTRSVAASLRAPPPVRGCTDCHESPHGPFGPETFIGDAADCARCHDARTFARSYGVAEHRGIGVDLAGAHASLPCESCHVPGRPRLASLDLCTTCHDDPHAPGGEGTAPVFAASAAGGAPRGTAGSSCDDCHSRDRFLPARVTAADHARFGSPLDGEHRDLACGSCHGRDRSGLPASIGECRACHDSPHRPGFEGEEPCASCHSAVSFRLVELGAARHAASGFALEPPHDTVPCAECHAHPAAPFGARFPGRRPDDCADCHSDPHGGLLEDGPFAGAGCLECHERTRFLPAAFELAAHGRTAFPLAGAHRAVPCQGCHRDRLVFAAAGTACADCHESPHRFPARNCADCHGTERFRPAIAPFDHAGRTGFPLAGAHGGLDCAACHGGGRARPSAGCATCHGDPHAGQFREYGEDSCLRCHSTESFTLPRFDHATQSSFALDGKHIGLPCAECHRPQRTRAGEMVVRYKPIPHDCADCHRAGSG